MFLDPQTQVAYNLTTASVSATTGGACCVPRNARHRGRGELGLSYPNPFFHSVTLGRAVTRLSAVAPRYAVWPPSMTIACPTTNCAASEHSQRTDPAISSGFPVRPTGSFAVTTL